MTPMARPCHQFSIRPDRLTGRQFTGRQSQNFNIFCKFSQKLTVFYRRLWANRWADGPGFYVFGILMPSPKNWQNRNIFPWDRFCTVGQNVKKHEKTGHFRIVVRPVDGEPVGLPVWFAHQNVRLGKAHIFGKVAFALRPTVSGRIRKNRSDFTRIFGKTAG